MDTIIGLADLFGVRSILIGLMIFVPLERLFTLRPHQKIFRQGLGNDVAYTVFNSAFTKISMIVVASMTMSSAAMLLPSGVAKAVAGQAIWLQVLEIIVITDLGVYIAHRAFHALPILWRFHSIHHSVEELDWIATFRTHPVDQIVTKTVSLAPVFFLGFSGEAILIYYLIYQGHALLLHSNVKIDFGPLKWLIASPQFHHWHHAEYREAYDTNFAGQLAIIDAIFGTFRVPGSAFPEEYGVNDPIPTNYFGQLGYPFLPRGKTQASVPVADSTAPDA